MRIITLTLNPAFDVHSSATGLKIYSENFINITSRDAGGKGVNVSRALSSVGRESIPLLLLGRENGEEFYTSLLSDGLSPLPIYTDGRIRENITIHEKECPETRISFSGFTVEGDVIARIKEAIDNIGGDKVIALTGSLPKGLDKNRLLSLLGEYKSGGATVVIDSRSITLSDIIDFKPFLIKPNKCEAELYTGKKIESYTDAIEIARELYSEGIKNVLISLGAEGAVLTTGDGCFFASAPRIEPVSTIGAGDSMVAGFIDATLDGASGEKALSRAVAFGTAACLTDGTKPPKRSDIESIERLIRVIKI